MNFSKFNIVIPPKDIQENPECMQRIAAGDREAFQWLYKNYSARLFEYVLVLTGDQYVSEDIVQDVFVKVWINKESLADVKNFNGYIYSIAKNCVMDTQRKEKIERNHLKKMSWCFEHDSVHLLEEKEKGKVFIEAVCSLTERQQLIYRLAREEGRSREEISKVLNISPFTVRNTMKNALREIRKKVLEGIK